MVTACSSSHLILSHITKDTPAHTSRRHHIPENHHLWPPSTCTLQCVPWQHCLCENGPRGGLYTPWMKASVCLARDSRVLSTWTMVWWMKWEDSSEWSHFPGSASSGSASWGGAWQEEGQGKSLQKESSWPHLTLLTSVNHISFFPLQFQVHYY